MPRDRGVTRTARRGTPEARSAAVRSRPIRPGPRIRPRSSTGSSPGSRASARPNSIGSRSPSRRRSPSPRPSGGSCHRTGWSHSTRSTVGWPRRCHQAPTGPRSATPSTATPRTSSSARSSTSSSPNPSAGGPGSGSRAAGRRPSVSPATARTRPRWRRCWSGSVGSIRTGFARWRTRVAAVAGTDAPWPPGLSAEEDDALRISAQLASSDAAAAVPAGTDAATRSQARRAATRPAHLLVFRHAYSAPAFAELTAPWRPWLVVPDAPPPRPRPAPR